MKYYMMYLLLGALATQAGLHVPSKKHIIVGVEQQGAPSLVPEIKPVIAKQNDLNKPCWLCQVGEQQTICQAFFSPKDDVRSVLLDLIEREQSSIRISIFTFTDKKVAQALIDKAGKGIVVEIITDKQSLKDRFSKIPLLIASGIPVYVYKPELTQGMYNDIMHHKFVIFERNIGSKPLLWTGSFNFTQSATLKNCENVIVIDDPRLIAQYKTHMRELKAIIGSPENISCAKHSVAGPQTMIDAHTASRTDSVVKIKKKAIKKS